MDSIKNSSDFKQVSRLGSKWVSQAFILQILNRNDKNDFRFGLTASRKVGNAVVRNRAKRRLREIIRDYPDKDKLTGMDLVFIARNCKEERDFALMQKDFTWCLKNLGIK